MSKFINIPIDSDVYEKFYIALSLTKEDENKVFENIMKRYIAESFAKASEEYHPIKQKDLDEITNDFVGKANRRIPIWAFRTEQYNHKIIKAYLLAEKATGCVSLSELERLCSNKSCPELYVPTFRSNYAQMKLDAPKSHGKVFEDDGYTVTVWDGVKDTLMQYKDIFIR